MPLSGDDGLINHPRHYQSAAGIEVIEVIEAFELGFLLGNVVKYVLRAGKKDDGVTDLQKAAWYLARALANETANALVRVGASEPVG